MPGKRIRQGTVLVLVLALALSLTGCWDRAEVEELGYVLAIGIDSAPKGDAYFTFWLAVPRRMASRGGGGGGGGESVHVATVEAASLGAATTLMNTYVARRVTLEHAKAFIVSEELARRDVLKFLAAATRFREFRQSIVVMVTRGTARDYLDKNRPSLEENPARWMEMMLAHQALSAVTVRSTVQQFLAEEVSGASLPVAVLTGLSQSEQQSPPGAGQGGAQSETMPLFTDSAYLPGEVPRFGLNPAEVIGAAVFRGAEMVAELNGDETRLLTMLRGDLRRTHLAQPDPKYPGYYVGLDVRQSRNPAVRVSFDGDRPVIDVKLNLEGDITAVQSFWDWTDPASVPILEQAVQTELKRRAQALVDRAQREFRGDPFGFGDRARGHFWTWKDWMDYRWNSRFPDARINVDVKFHVRRVGLQLSPPAPPADAPQPGGKGQEQGAGQL